MSEKTELLDSLEELRRQGLLTSEEYEVQCRAIHAEFASTESSSALPVLRETYGSNEGRTSTRLSMGSGIVLGVLTVLALSVVFGVGLWLWSIVGDVTVIEAPVEEIVEDAVEVAGHEEHLGGAQGPVEDGDLRHSPVRGLRLGAAPAVVDGERLAARAARADHWQGE